MTFYIQHGKTRLICNLFVRFFLKVKQLYTYSLFVFQFFYCLFQIFIGGFFVGSVIGMPDRMHFHNLKTGNLVFHGLMVNSFSATKDHQTVVAGDGMQPGLKKRDFVFEKILLEFFKDVHDGIFGFIGIFQVFEANTVELMCIALEKQTKGVFFALFVQGDQLQVGFFTEVVHVYSSDENTGNIFEEMRSMGKLINGPWAFIIIATNARILGITTNARIR